MRIILPIVTGVTAGLVVVLLAKPVMVNHTVVVSDNELHFVYGKGGQRAGSC